MTPMNKTESKMFKKRNEIKCLFVTCIRFTVRLKLCVVGGKK